MTITPEQIDALNRHQRDRQFHPYTCGSGRRTDAQHLDGEGVLVATAEGWVCPYCDYRQPYRGEESLQQSGSILEAFQALWEAGGHGWDEVEDPKAYLEEMTGE